MHQVNRRSNQQLSRQLSQPLRRHSLALMPRRTLRLALMPTPPHQALVLLRAQPMLQIRLLHRKSPMHLLMHLPMHLHQRSRPSRLLRPHQLNHQPMLQLLTPANKFKP